MFHVGQYEVVIILFGAGLVLIVGPVSVLLSLAAEDSVHLPAFVRELGWVTTVPTADAVGIETLRDRVDVGRG